MIKTKYISLLVLITWLCSCSQFSKSPTSRAWHNMNAKYNALLIAREDYNYGKKILANMEIYNAYTSILPKIDSSKLDSAKIYFEDAVKKSSMIAERHSNSKFVDEAYLLLGKARLEKQEYFNAIETYKYLNANAHSLEKKHEALIELFKAYIYNEDYQTSNQLIDLLKKEKLNQKNKIQFLLILSHFYAVQNQEKTALVFLEEALKFKIKSSQRSRYYFVAGKMNENLGNQVNARKYYKQTLKSKPPYGLAFEANMGLLGTQSLAKNTSLAFEDMLEDRKNQDLKAAIYQKMAAIELRKKNFDQAIAFYTKSNTEPSSNNSLKVNAYQNIANLYQYQLLDYQKASLYLDSTLSVTDVGSQNRDEVMQRKLYLKDFIKYQEVLTLEDSVQKLALMNPVELEEKLLKLAKSEIEKTKKSLDIPAIENNQKTVVNTSKSTWLFYDPIQVVKAKNEYIRIWGNRPLEDNWRRQEKTAGSFSIKIEKTKLSDNPEINSDSLAALTAKKKAEAEEEELNIWILDHKRNIPFTEAKLIASKRKQEEALYQIGKIYNIRFKEPDKTKKYFQEILEKHPKSEYTAEVLYTLALMENNPANSAYGIKLIESFPFSSFVRLLKGGSKKLDKSQENEVEEVYRKMFRLYENSDYENTSKGLEDAMTKFAGSQMEDKLAMLRIFCLKKLGNKDVYTIALNDFVRSYPSSPLINTAKEYLSVLY